MAVWHTIPLLLAYLSMIFFMTRLLEVFNDQLSHRSLNATNMSASKLRTVLESRGVIFDDGILEKKEILRRIEASGSISQEELNDATAAVHRDVPLTEYTYLKSMVIIVEPIINVRLLLQYAIKRADSKENVLLVEVVAGKKVLLSDADWRAVKLKVGKFGVRFGIFCCSRNNWLCKENNWTHSRVVLFFRGRWYNPKSTIFTHVGSIRINSVLDWIKRTAWADNVSVIKDITIFREKWRTFGLQLMPEIRIVCLSPMPDIPMFVSALGAMFPGRIKIGSIDTRSDNGKHIVREADILSKSPYVVLTPEGAYAYGLRKGEIFNVRAIETFIKSFYPTYCDLFTISIVFSSGVGLIGITYLKRPIRERMRIFFHIMFIYNCIPLLGWIVHKAIFRLDILSCPGLTFLRAVVASLIFCLNRIDAMYNTYPTTLPLVSATLIMATIVFLKHSNRGTHIRCWQFNKYIEAHVTIRELYCQQVRFYLSVCLSIYLFERFQLWQVSLFFWACLSVTIWSCLAFMQYRDLICSSYYSSDMHNNFMFSRTSHTSVQDYIVADECSICLCDYNDLDPVIGIPCRHVFHEKCLSNWMPMGVQKCPLCRADTTL